MLAIDILKWPGMNQAFLFSFFLTLVLIGLAVAYGKRRPADKPTSWGEAMAGSAYAFFVMFLAFGVVPHQWLTHVQNELGWQSDKPFLGPGSIFKSKAKGGDFAFDINYQQIGDILVTGIYGLTSASSSGSSCGGRSAAPSRPPRASCRPRPSAARW
jgi:hypothetical protein